MKRPSLHLLLCSILIGCSTTSKMQRGAVNPSVFRDTVTVTTAKGIVLIPCEYEGVTKNYYFDTGAQLTDIQRTKLKGKQVEVRGASGRSQTSGTETLRSFRIGQVEFKNTFATNTDAVGLKEQIPNYGGTLGRPIIDRANWLIDLANDRVVLSNQDLSTEGFVNVKTHEKNDGAPHTTLHLGGQSFEAIIDLGSTAMVNAPEDSEFAEYLLREFPFELRERDRYTVGGLKRVTEKIVVLPKLQVGELISTDVEVSINQSSQVRVGMNLFEGHLIYIDNDFGRYMIK